jgi:hypothetical protein
MFLRLPAGDNSSGTNGFCVVIASFSNLISSQVDTTK